MSRNSKTTVEIHQSKDSGDGVSVSSQATKSSTGKSRPLSVISSGSDSDNSIWSDSKLEADTDNSKSRVNRNGTVVTVWQ